MRWNYSLSHVVMDQISMFGKSFVQSKSLIHSEHSKFSNAISWDKLLLQHALLFLAGYSFPRCVMCTQRWMCLFTPDTRHATNTLPPCAFSRPLHVNHPLASKTNFASLLWSKQMMLSVLGLVSFRFGLKRFSLCYCYHFGKIQFVCF